MTLALDIGIVLGTIAAMEWVASIIHRHVMHGFGWNWHQSHHRQRSAFFERNDLYALCFAALSIACFALGAAFAPIWRVGAGMVAYGILYALLHDGLVHRRLPLPRRVSHPYLKRLVQAHKLHHATSTKAGAVSFGFLYARPVRLLVREMREQRLK